MSNAPGLTYHELKAHDPCEGSFRRVTKLLGGAKKWNGKKIGAREAREAGATYDDILWVAFKLARTDKDVERRLRLDAADCAAHVLHLFEREYPTDMRPRNAIIAARQYARGEITTDVLGAARAAAWAAWAAGAAAGAARAAAGAARDAAGATRDAAGAAWAARAAAGADGAAAGAASDAAWAAWAAAGAARDAAWAAPWAAERTWQFDRLIARLSEEEPEDYPLPEPQQ